jgi:DNA-binding NarL/FixJ family response regulator
MERHINLLVGCNEPLVVEALQILLTTAAQDGKAFEFTTSRRSDEFIQQARSGEFDMVIMHANCLSPTQPCTPFENAIHAVKNIKTSVPLKLIALTTMEEWVAPLRDSGVDVSLKAPFAAKELLDAISALI